MGRLTRPMTLYLDANIPFRIAEFGKRFFGISCRQRSTMPALLIGQKGDPRSFQGLCDDHRRPIGTLRLTVGSVNGLDIVPIYQNGMPPEGPNPLGIHLTVPLQHSGTALPQPVHI